MREGLAADDIWIMVEDEFLATARLFTQHLHHAEYKRLRNLVKSQNASVIQSIARPIDITARLSTEARLRLQASVKSKAQQEALDDMATSTKSTTHGANTEEDEDNEPWSRDSTLAGLMAPSRELSTRLASLVGTRSNTRAAAGFTKAKAPSLRTPGPRLVKPELEAQLSTDKNRPLDGKPDVAGVEITGSSPEGGDDGDENDLDAPAYAEPRSPRVAEARRVQPSTQEVENTCEDLVPPRPPRPPDGARFVNGTRSRANPSRSSMSSASVSSPPIGDLGKEPNLTLSQADSLENMPKRQALRGEFAARMARRKTEAAKREREDRRKSLSINEIPTFLV